jgi:hypothetical protein
MVQRIMTWRKRFVLQFRELNGTASDAELLDATLKAFAAEAEFADVEVAAAATGDVNAMVVPMDNDYYALSEPFRCTECGASHMYNTRRLHTHSGHTRTPSRTHTQV